MSQDAVHAFCRCAPLSLHSMFKAHNKCQVNIIIFINFINLMAIMLTQKDFFRIVFSAHFKFKGRLK